MILSDRNTNFVVSKFTLTLVMCGTVLSQHTGKYLIVAKFVSSGLRNLFDLKCKGEGQTNVGVLSSYSAVDQSLIFVDHFEQF